MVAQVEIRAICSFNGSTPNETRYATGIAVALSAIAAGGGSAEPVLMLNDPRDVIAAKSSCDSAENEVKADQYLSKAHQCGESHLCRRALNINAGVWPHRRSTGISHQALGAICQQCSVQHGDQASHTRLYNAGVGIVALKGRPDYCLWGSRRGRRSRPDCSRRLHYNDA